MRFMMFIYPKVQGGTAAAVEQAWMPPAEAVVAMTKYNDELSKAGVLLSLDGLHSPDKAVRIEFPSGKPPVVKDGPFTEAKEMIGGYWVIDVKSQDEAIEWAKRCPIGEGAAEIELRQVFEMSDFPADLQAAARAAQK
ncbi:MAG TPA: YciI family protein [Acidimicrobiales bacterium]|nr:YciI family protein [Acidimicrobiales bacterium]